MSNGRLYITLGSFFVPTQFLAPMATYKKGICSSSLFISTVNYRIFCPLSP
jgi:hypothetical protein